MAVMYPSKVYEEAQDGEKLVYDALQKLPDDWIVFHDCWQHYREKNTYVNYEADFIVLVPLLGIAVLEVKDWSIPVRIHEGEWQIKPNKKGWKPLRHKQSPLNQAFLASKHLKKVLERHVLPPENKYETRCMAVLLNQIPSDLHDTYDLDAKCFRSSNNPPIDHLYLLGHKALEPEELEKRIKRLFIFHNTNMTSEIMHGVVDYLAPSLLFQRDLKTYTAKIERAGAGISRLLPMLDASKGGIRVDGCAGSGKTVMACCEAARLAHQADEDGDEDFRILVLCFNTNLANKLAKTPQLAPHTRGARRRVDVNNFHNFCIDRYLKPAGQEHLLNREGGEWMTPEALDFVARRLSPTYDAIFVDEAQDFRGEWWDRVVLRLLKPGGRLRVFADTNQNIYRNDDNIPDIPTRVTLDTNLRNGCKIAAFSSALLPEKMRMNLLPLSGADVAILPGSDQRDQRAQSVVHLIEEIRSQHPIAPRDIAVLSPWRKDNLRGSLQLIEKLCDESLRPLLSTIKSFKGLEASFVILVDIPAAGPDQHPPFTINDLYVACTRARYSLTIVPTVAGEKCVRRFLEESAQIARP